MHLSTIYVGMQQLKATSGGLCGAVGRSATRSSWTRPSQLDARINVIPSHFYVIPLIVNLWLYFLLSLYCCYLDTTSHKQDCYLLFVTLRFSATKRDCNDVSASKIMSGLGMMPAC